MRPLPKHLRGVAVPRSAVVDEGPLDADVRCPCGGAAFELLYPGATHEYRGERIPCTKQVGDQFFFMIKAKCVACGRTHLLFDKDFHGWGGYVGHDELQAALPRPELEPWKCSACGGIAHGATVNVQGEGRADFVENAGEGFDADTWPDGFSWFGMSVHCKSCRKDTPVWVGYETV
jgi:hypothetical protein